MKETHKIKGCDNASPYGVYSELGRCQVTRRVLVIYGSSTLLRIMVNTTKLQILSNISKLRAPEKTLHLFAFKTDVKITSSVIVLVFYSSPQSLKPKHIQTSRRGPPDFAEKLIPLCNPWVKRSGDHCSFQVFHWLVERELLILDGRKFSLVANKRKVHVNSET